MNGRSTYPMPKPRRGDWIARIASKIGTLWMDKYISGEKEHVTDLGAITTRQLAVEMRNEALDQLAYAEELLRRLDAEDGR